MRMPLKAVAFAVAAPLATSGCAVAMLGGAGALPAAMAMVGAADALGAMPSFAGSSVNPALQVHPDVGGGELAAIQRDMIGRLGVLARDPGGRLTASGGGVACSLSDDAVWRLAGPAGSRDAWLNAMAGLPPALRPQVVSVEATLIEGRCADGRLSGPFVAVGRFESQVSGQIETNSVERVRVEGVADSSGEIAGAFLREAESLTTGPRIGFVHRSLSAARSVVGVDGAPSESVTVVQSFDEDGNLNQVATTVIEREAGGIQRMFTWAGPYLFLSSTLRDGRMDGWSTTHPVSFVQGASPGERTMTCYRAGEQAPDSACVGMPSM